MRKSSEYKLPEWLHGDNFEGLAWSATSLDMDTLILFYLYHVFILWCIFVSNYAIFINIYTTICIFFISCVISPQSWVKQNKPSDSKNPKCRSVQGSPFYLWVASGATSFSFFQLSADCVVLEPQYIPAASLVLALSCPLLSCIAYIPGSLQQQTARGKQALCNLHHWRQWWRWSQMDTIKACILKKKFQSKFYIPS